MQLPRFATLTFLLSAWFLSAARAQTQTQTPPIQASQTPTLELPTPAPDAPPTAQVYLSTPGAAPIQNGHTMVPATFFSDAIGASVGPVAKGQWRLLYFGRQIDFYDGQRGVRVDGLQDQMPVPARVYGQDLHVSMRAFCEWLGLKWSVARRGTDKTVFLVQFPAAYIKDVRTDVQKERVRTVIELSNATRVSAYLGKTNANFEFAGRQALGVSGNDRVKDYLVTGTTLRSGSWKAKFAVKLNYAAPLSWFTLGNPSRIVIDAQRLFEEQATDYEGGLALTKIRKGTGHGPVQMWAARFDPRDGWRVRVEPGGASVLERERPSRMASRKRAVLAVNGGFFAYDGAAVGTVLVGGKWLRLPWQGRTAVGFDKAGRARIGSLRTDARVNFGDGTSVIIRDLNGWPDAGRVTALTSDFGKYYKLSPGEMALVVENGAVTSKPGGGGVNIPAKGFVLVASGGARPPLERVARGTRAKLSIKPINWPTITTALGGGPRLVRNGQIYVTSEGFRPDVLNGTGPRTAFGIDKAGRYIILVADGRQGYYSTGLTLQELAATMQKLGAVDAMNLDGGGSTALVVKGKVINRPSDGVERRVSNALLVMR